MGGMGNQMFQYATARALSNKLGLPLKLDLSFLLERTSKENFTYRDFELGNFNIKEDIASDKEIRYYNIRNRLYKLFIQKILGNESVVYYHEKLSAYNSSFEKLNSNTYLEGYWQTEKYFKQIRPLLLREFAFKEPPNEVNSGLLESINNQKSVSVHIRRGDFISNKAINKYHGICDIDYYSKAIKEIVSKVSSPTFYFFSDDIEWVKFNFKDIGFDCKFVSNNTGSNSFEDMRLMSACKHNIIANSSFSWWGAWLNSNSEKIVVAPVQWFSKAEIDSKDLVPADWIKI